jgi:hypothetical protein
MEKRFKQIVVQPDLLPPLPAKPKPAATVIPTTDMTGFVEDAPVASPAPVSVNGRHLPKLSKKFLLAGRALYTVDNGSGEHYTFKVRLKKGEWNGKPSETYFVQVKAPGGPWPYQYIGILNPDTGHIKCTSKSAFLPGTKEYDVAAWSTQVVIRGTMIPSNYDVRHAGKCGKCAKTLTDPESIERGIGPECWKKMK